MPVSVSAKNLGSLVELTLTYSGLPTGTYFSAGGVLSFTNATQNGLLSNGGSSVSGGIDQMSFRAGLKPAGNVGPYSSDAFYGPVQKIYLTPTGAGSVTYSLHDTYISAPSGYVQFPVDTATASGSVDVAAPVNGGYTMSSDGTGASILVGGPGNDFVIDPGPWDFVQVGAGVDTLVFSKPSTAFTIAPSYDPFTQTTATKLMFGDPWSAFGIGLSTVERLRFSDVDLAMDLGGTGHATAVARLMGAVLGAASLTNREYVGIGLSLADAGMSASDLAQLALDVRFGAGAGVDQIVDGLYENVVGSLPDTAEHAYYASLVTSGQMTLPQLAILAAETSQTALNIDLVGLAEHGLAYQPA